jgi:hypothetical protein
MARDIKENIILPAWEMVSDDFSLKKFYLIP